MMEDVRFPPDLDSDILIALCGELVERFDNLSVFSFGMPAVVRKGIIGLCELDKLSRFEPEMDGSYKKGLFHRGMKLLTCGFEMIDL